MYSAMGHGQQEGDVLPTDRQLALAEWLSDYKGAKIPDRAYLSRRAWWGWVNSQITQIDREDAREAQIDFGLKFDPSDPIGIVGAIKYRSVVNATRVVDRAVRQLLRGIHPHYVQEDLSLTDDQLDEAAVIVATEHHYEIDWGSA